MWCVCVCARVLGKFKSHRASVDYLWQHFTAVDACVWVNTCTCVCVTPWVTRASPQCFRFFSSNKIPAQSASCSLGRSSRPERNLAHFPVMWWQVWTGMLPALNRGHRCLSVSTEEWHHADSSAFIFHCLKAESCFYVISGRQGCSNFNPQKSPRLK